MEEGKISKESRHGSANNSRDREQDLLYDPNVATSSHAEQAITLASTMSSGTLSTISVKSSGHPYGSFVTYIIYRNNPIFLISDLAEHTKNLESDSKASLMISEIGEGNPLALGRLTLVGECKKMPRESFDLMKEKFVEKHPSSSYYVDYTDFSFFELKVASIRYIGGFGRMSWIDEGEWIDVKPDPLISSAQDIITHMNDDHSDALLLYCQNMSKAVDATEAVMTAIDRYGFEMSATTSLGQRPIRLAFTNEVSSPDEARKELVTMVKRARELSKK
ncbi:MAG: DUF2470 domain-containing protein [Candidatus Thalassarchaeaceae archaeon]|nr:DUF2470 domain-containing protein [Candidatus Thalassarchaeaceae archaeon]|tara:strand:- start:31247 stop:32077 length:831 start_codon:yes stop_codon:yes gene_type:complete